MLAPVIAKQLKELGYDGSVASLKRFQASKGIRPTGIVDPQTRITLERMARAAQGNKDQFVSRLNPPPADLGLKPGPGEMALDPTLTKAIEEYRKKHPESVRSLARWTGRPVGGQSAPVAASGVPGAPIKKTP
jgi:hypothetical protein